MNRKEAPWWQEYHAELTREWREMPADTRAVIPEHLQDGLDRYILDRIRPGGFLTALLENDLAQVAGRANPRSVLLVLPDLLCVLHGYAPGMSYGSPKNVAEWLAAGKGAEDA